MELFYYIPTYRTSDVLFEVRSQNRAYKSCTTLRSLQEELKTEFERDRCTPVVIVLATHGNPDGSIELDEGPPLFANQFYNGLVKPSPGLPNTGLTTSPWDGLKKLAGDRKNRGRRHVYVLAAQCYSIQFSETMPKIEDDGVFVIGLCAVVQHVLFNYQFMWAVNKEVEEHLKFIEKIENQFSK